MHPVIALALVMVAGIVATRLPRFPTSPPMLDVLVVAGSHLLLLGVVLGPGTGVLDAATLRALTPVTALGIGWLGARFGARFEWRWLRRLPQGVWALALVQAGAAFAAVNLVAALLARVVPALGLAWPAPRLATIVALGAIAAVSAPDLVTLAARRLGVAPKLVRALRAAATLDSAFGVLALALALGARRLGMAGGLPIALGTGLLVGALFAWLGRLLVGPEDLSVLLMGVVLLGAGAGYAAGVSPFLVCAVATALASQFLPRRRPVTRRLVAWEHPILAVFLILTGALLGLPTLWLLLVGVVLAAIRIAARWTAVRHGRRWLRALRSVPLDAGLGAVAQGGIAVALAVGWHLSRGPGTAGVLTTVVLGAALSQLAAGLCMARAVRVREF